MLTATGGILVLLILLLAVPVNVVYALKKDEGWRGRIVVYWMFGLVHLSLRPGRRRKVLKAERRRRGGGARLTTVRKLVERRRDLFAVLRTPGFIRRLIYLLRDLVGSSKPRRLQVQLIIGMEDPADTGRLWGMLAPFRFLFGRRTIGNESNMSIDITPDFSGPRFKGYSCASVQIVPLRIIALVLGFIFSAPVFRAARVMMQRSGA
jgi:hypothetical protein